MIGFIHIGIIDIIDIVLVAVLMFQFYRLIRGTAAIRIFAAILIIYLVWQITQALQLKLFSKILGQFISVGVLALIIVFQQEIRRFLLYLGSSRILNKSFLGRWLMKFSSSEESAPLMVEPIINAVFSMSASKTGGLIVVSNQSELKFYVQTGVEIDALINDELLESIFFKNSPLHDGAVIINNNRIVAAKCVLPLSERELPPYFGLRHRAATGITETSTAVAIVVSEETGEISFFENGEHHTVHSKQELQHFLRGSEE